MANAMRLSRKTLRVVYGSNISKGLVAGGEVVGGWVADVAEVFTTCRIFVVALKSGAGLKGKVVGALSHGVPSIISPVAMEGVGAAEGVDVLVAEKPQQWVQAITSLYSDPEKWQAMSNAARRTWHAGAIHLQQAGN